MIYILLLFLSYVNSYTFPYGRCYDTKCSSSPYRLVWSIEKVNDTMGQYCLTFKNQDCINTSYNCCNMLQKNLNKFELHLRTECKKSIELVTINNIKKGVGVYFDEYTNTQSELRITNLNNINTSTAETTELCIYVKQPCIPLSNFIFSAKSAIWEVSKHECCPQCEMMIINKYPREPPLPDSCGNHICEPNKTENCMTCPSDCRKTKKHCCGLNNYLKKKRCL